MKNNKQSWNNTFKTFYDNVENGGSSRWLVSPDVVEILMNHIAKSEYERGRKEENLAWLEHKRCFTCGRKMKPSPTTDTCHQCWEEN